MLHVVEIDLKTRAGVVRTLMKLPRLATFLNILLSLRTFLELTSLAQDNEESFYLSSHS